MEKVLGSFRTAETAITEVLSNLQQAIESSKQDLENQRREFEGYVSTQNLKIDGMKRELEKKEKELAALQEKLEKVSLPPEKVI